MRDTLAFPWPRTAVTGALYDNSQLFGGRIRITAFGRHYDKVEVDEDWSFRHLRPRDDGTLPDSSLSRHLPAIAKELDITEILAPSPIDFNARMCYAKELAVFIPVDRNLVVRRGTNADGCRLNLGQTFGISLAGCSQVIAWYPHNPQPGEKIIVATAHAGFNSLVDRQNALTGIPSRKPESVIENLLTAMGCSKQRANRRKRVGAVITFPISHLLFRYPWNHPELGEENRKICEYLLEKWGPGCVPGNNGTGRGQGSEAEGQISLAEIITKQFTDLGVPLENLGLILDSDLLGNLEHPRGGEIWYTTRGRPEFKAHRNLLLITRVG